MAAVQRTTHYGQWGRKLLRALRSNGPEDLNIASYISYGLNMAATSPGTPIPGVTTLTKVPICRMGSLCTF